MYEYTSTTSISQFVRRTDIASWCHVLPSIMHEGCRTERDHALHSCGTLSCGLFCSGAGCWTFCGGMLCRGTLRLRNDLLHGIMFMFYRGVICGRTVCGGTLRGTPCGVFLKLSSLSSGGWFKRATMWEGSQCAWQEQTLTLTSTALDNVSERSWSEEILLRCGDTM